MNKKLIKTMTAGVLVLALLFTGFSGLKAVFAQTTTPETPATPSTTGTQVLPGRGNQDTSDDSLAAVLGKTAAEMQAARKAVYEKAIDQAVTDGALTQAQADRLKANSGNGWGLLSNLIGSEEVAKLDEQALFAEALGITLDELNAAYAQVHTDRLADLVASGKLTQEQADAMAAGEALQQSTTFQAEVKASREAAINNAVKAGTITQTQADALLARIQNQNRWENGFGGFGGMQGGMMNNNGMMSRSMFGQRLQGMFDQIGERMFGQGGQGRFNEKDFNGQGMVDQGGQGTFGQGGRGMNGQGGQGMNGNCDGTCQYAPTPTVDGTDG
jgi:polyhydroxyalkanoate synthesis regulator phasin